MDVEEALCTQAVKRLSRRHKIVSCDAETDVLLSAIDEGRGGHAGTIGLTLGAGLLTLRSGAVTPQSWKCNSLYD